MMGALRGSCGRSEVNTTWSQSISTPIPCSTRVVGLTSHRQGTARSRWISPQGNAASAVVDNSTRADTSTADTLLIPLKNKIARKLMYLLGRRIISLKSSMISQVPIEYIDLPTWQGCFCCDWHQHCWHPPPTLVSATFWATWELLITTTPCGRNLWKTWRKMLSVVYKGNEGDFSWNLLTACDYDFRPPFRLGKTN